MRVALEELASRVASSDPDKLPGIILLNGNEPILLEEALDQLRHQLRQCGFTERLTYQLDSSFDWSNLTGLGQAMSLFAERRMVELRVPKSLGVKGTRAITEYCNNPPRDDLLVLIMPALDKRQRQAKWAKLVDSGGWIADGYEISAQQFPGWLKHRLQSRSLRVEPGVVNLLAEKLEGNVLAAAQEVDKLQVLARDGAVTLKIVNESLADQARFDVYALTDACLLGDFTRAVRIHNRLQSEGIEPVIVVWALVREVRTLAQICYALGVGGNRDALFKQHRIWSKRAPLINSALDRLDDETCSNLLLQAAHLDQSVKGQRNVEVGSVWHQIEKFCHVFCGTQFMQRAS